MTISSDSPSFVLVNAVVPMQLLTEPSVNFKSVSYSVFPQSLSCPGVSSSTSFVTIWEIRYIWEISVAV